MKITLATVNGKGAVAGISVDEDTDFFVGEMDIYGDEDDQPDDVCREAARMLRKAAKRFDLLARMPRPLQASTQDDINDIDDDSL